jgi:NitT/TauT family transport system permease protein
VEKTFSPTEIIQMIPILGMAPIVLALTKSIDKSRIVIAAILTFYRWPPTRWPASRRWKGKSGAHVFLAPAGTRCKEAAHPLFNALLFTGLQDRGADGHHRLHFGGHLQGGSGLADDETVPQARDDHLRVLADRVSERHRGILNYRLMAALEKWASPYRRNPKGPAPKPGALP